MPVLVSQPTVLVWSLRRAGGVQIAVSEKEEAIRATLAKLDDAAADASAPHALSANDLALLRRQLTESQTVTDEAVERARQAQEENELLGRRRDELEARLSNLEQEYEELLERGVADVDPASGGGAGLNGSVGGLEDVEALKAKLEAQYASKRDASQQEATTLKHQLDIKTQENRSLVVTIDSLKGANEELKVRTLSKWCCIKSDLLGAAGIRRHGGRHRRRQGPRRECARHGADPEDHGDAAGRL